MSEVIEVTIGSDVIATVLPESAVDATTVAALAAEIARAQTAEATKQPLDADLTAIAALDSSAAGAIASDGAGWVKKTYTQFKTALGLVKADVGLANVDNTSDANKPVSTATQTALNGKADLSGPGSTVPRNQLPNISGSFWQQVANQAAMLALTAPDADTALVVFRTDTPGTVWFLNPGLNPATLGNWGSYQDDAAGAAAAAQTAAIAAAAADATTKVAAEVTRANNTYLAATPWATATTYAVGQSVSNAGFVWQALTAHTSSTTFDLTKWLPVAWAPTSYFTPEMYGAKGDGATDDTAAILAADAAAQTNGGTVYFQAGKTYRCNGALIRAYTGTTSPKTRPVRWTSNGGGPAWDGTWPSTVDTSGCAVLDLRYDGLDGLYPAKITTLGAGHFEVDRLAIVSGGSDNWPIFQTTNTTVDVHHNFIRGNAANSGASCVQDAIVFGGTSTNIDNTTNAAFQGYGSEVHHNFFARVRRQFYGRTYCNSIAVYNNTSSTSCGSDHTAAAVEFLGVSGNADTGNFVYGNTIEVVNYAYALKAAYAVNNTFGPNGYWDPNANYLASVWLDTTSTNNTVVDGYHNDTYPFCLDLAGSNDVDRGAHGSQTSVHYAPHQYRAGVLFSQSPGFGVASMDSGGDLAALNVSAGANPYPVANIWTKPAVQFTDMVTINTARWVTSATAAFVTTDIALPVLGTGIPNFTFIAKVASATSAEPWRATTAYNVGHIGRPNTANTHLYQVTTAGTSGSSEPTWPTTAGNTVTDGTVVWTCLATGVTAAYLSKVTSASGTGVTLNIGRSTGTPLTMTGFSRHHILSTGSAPSVAADASAGTGGSVGATVVGTDIACTVTLVTGSASTAAGQLFHIAPAINWTAVPKIFVSARDAATAALLAGGYHTSGSATNSIKISTVNVPATGATYVFDVWCIQ